MASLVWTIPSAHCTPLAASASKTSRRSGSERVASFSSLRSLRRESTFVQGESLGFCTTVWQRAVGQFPAATRTSKMSRGPDCAAEKLTPDNVTVLVCGGGGVGMEIVRQLAKAGGWVTALQRGEKFRKEIEGLGAMLAVGDLLKPDTIAKALSTNTFDAVICTAGGGITDHSVDSEGAINLIEAAKKAGVSRFILVTSIGTGDSAKAITEAQMEILGAVLREKGKAENHLMASGLTWTIIRPGGLLSEALTGTAILTEDKTVSGAIARPDVARLALSCLFNPVSEGKILAAIDAAKRQPTSATGEVKEFAVV